MTHISLFAGIGGIDLAGEWAGFRTIAQVERNSYCWRVLEKHWPGVHRVKEIRDFPDQDYGAVTLISGGFPCQPFSAAGKRRGTKDDRYLWPEMLRIIQAVKPAWVLAENVPGLLTIERGMVFESMLVDLEIAEYEIIPPFLIPVAGIGADQLRYRIFIVAHTTSERMGNNGGKGKIKNDMETGDNNGIRISTYGAGRSFELDQSRMDRIINGIPDQLDRNKILGNAVVPAQIYPILKAIAEVEKANDN